VQVHAVGELGVGQLDDVDLFSSVSAKSRRAWVT
jgi:hypothetical protein